MDGFLPIFFLMIVLKIPVGMLLFLVWWAFRAETKPEEAPPDGGDHRFRRFRREPKRPRGPRRGGHGPGALPLPNPRRSASPEPALGLRSSPQRLRSRTTA